MADVAAPTLARRIGTGTGIALLAGAVVLASVVLAVSVGAVAIPPGTVWGIALDRIAPGLVTPDWSPGSENIVWEIRFPRVILAGLVGAGLGLVGAALQSVTRNPLADPPSLRDFPASVCSQPASFSAKGSILLCRSGVADFGSIMFADKCLATVFRDMPVSREISRIDSFCRKCIRRMIFNMAMWITPLTPPLKASGKGSHGPSLSENYAPNRLRSG
ncbi:MAG: iron chelate uptake ABC transporter family permease subunit [Tabrizicola sp.]